MLEHEGNGYSLRLAAEDDVAAVLEIEKKSYPFPWTEEAFRNELLKPFSRFMVLTDDQADATVVGYIVYWLIFDECHVLNVTIDPEFRGRGLATQLMRRAMNEALKKEMKRVFLEVRKSNAAAIRLYQKLGFFIDHVKPHFYEDREDAYFMVLYFNQPAWHGDCK